MDFNTTLMALLSSHSGLCLVQTMPTDMCALEDFEEPDKLHIQVNDIITIIEGRWVCFGSPGVSGSRLLQLFSPFNPGTSPPSGRRTTGGEAKTNAP